MTRDEVAWEPLDAPPGMTDLEQNFLFQVRAAGWPTPEYNQRLVPRRRYQCDFVWRDYQLVVEVEGGTHARRGAKRCPACGQTPTGRHTTAKGYAEDCRKYNALALLGYRVLRFTTEMIRSGEALGVLERALRS